MEITTRQIQYSELPAIDMIIAASGYEERSIHIATKIDRISSNSLKICFGFSSHKNNEVRKANDKVFKDLKYEIFIGDGNDDFLIERVLKDKMPSLVSDKEINILVDYSSMTRTWFASILRFFYYSGGSEDVNVYFAYSHAKYEAPPKQLVRNIHVSPIEGYSTFVVPDKPTALIIGLGYEPEKALGLTEYFDAKTFVFYNDTSKGERFSRDVEKMNRELLDSIPSENIFTYPINNLTFTESVLYDLCRSLKDKYRVIIAPCGPKPFALISLLVSLRIPGVDVWRISPGDNGECLSRKPSGDVLIYDVNLLDRVSIKTTEIKEYYF